MAAAASARGTPQTAGVGCRACARCSAETSVSATRARSVVDRCHSVAVGDQRRAVGHLEVVDEGTQALDDVVDDEGVLVPVLGRGEQGLAAAAVLGGIGRPGGGAGQRVDGHAVSVAAEQQLGARAEQRPRGARPRGRQVDGEQVQPRVAAGQRAQHGDGVDGPVGEDLERPGQHDLLQRTGLHARQGLGDHRLVARGLGHRPGDARHRGVGVLGGQHGAERAGALDVLGDDEVGARGGVVGQRAHRDRGRSRPCADLAQAGQHGVRVGRRRAGADAAGQHRAARTGEPRALAGRPGAEQADRIGGALGGRASSRAGARHVPPPVVSVPSAARWHRGAVRSHPPRRVLPGPADRT